MIAVTVGQVISSGTVIAQLYDIFGCLLNTIRSNEPSMVLGVTTNPVALPGTRIAHLGLPLQPGETLPTATEGNY